jgi:DNA polymerase-3 subunit delta'
VSSVWDGVLGQERATAQARAAAAAPVHAYLFVGPAGSTKEVAARAFAATVIAGSDDPEGRDARLILAGEHPDVHEYHRVGAAISAEQARAIATEAAMSATESDRKVLILHEFHLLRPEGAALLLKTIEEPPAGTMFVICANAVPADLVTIASRCVRIDFRAIPEELIAERLRAEGADPAVAEAAARSANGSLDRARLLAVDPMLDRRRQAFAELPRRIDGTGATALSLIDELLGLIDDAAAPLAARHESEIAGLNERIAQLGERGSGRKQLEERHKRELRRHRTDELRSGLATLASSYRDALVADPTHVARPDAVVDAVGRIHTSLEDLERNPNETLLLASLLWSLPALPPLASSPAPR